jgi:hypothetical protein
MAKKQTRRSISVSRTTYERLKAFCESNNISMSQLVETRVNDFLGPSDLPAGGVSTMMPTVAPRSLPGHAAQAAQAPRPAMSSGLPTRPLDARPASHHAPGASAGPTAIASQAPHATPAGGHPVAQGSHVAHGAQASQAVPMTSAAARFAVEPPPPIIKPRQDTAAPKPAEKRPEQIFTF